MEYVLAARRREKMKLNKNKDADDVYTSSWFAFDSMKFLWDKSKPSTSVNTVLNQSKPIEYINRDLSKVLKI
ncbi:hypothetical protein PR048_024355 [Dryococelus australis]|uniref:Uncharacterized protein n=1 Tax=Dryococelus australis TaxID=614101 RepID=A0ABQ9GNC4_9NEOP|nr:hypothetical protein PR048_024355 [Dryococelus australis]